MKIYNINRELNDEDIIEICDLIKECGCDKLKEIKLVIFYCKCW